MSKVISFSISDKYLEKLRTLYPSLTDNLAAKQFLTDRLDSSLGNSLDDGLDDGLDGKLKTLIESELDDVLDERLDAVVGKLITSLSERMARLEARLDTNLDGGLDEMELLLKREREASITSLIPTGEPSPFPTIGENPDIEPVATVETADDTVETVDETDTSPLPNQETVEIADTVEPISSIEPVEPAIGPVRGDSPQPKNQLSEGMNAADAHRYLTSKGVKVSEKTLSDWISKIKQIPMTGKGDAVSEYLILRDGRYYPID